MAIRWVTRRRCASCVTRRKGGRLASAGRGRRQAETAAETAVEIGQGVKAAFEGNVADAPLAMREPLRRLVQPPLGQPCRKTGAGLEQQFVDIALRQTGRLGELLALKNPA